MFSSLRYFWSEAFKSLFRNQFMAIASVLTVTVSMFILGGFLCVVLNINHMASYLENQVEMTVYLKEGLRTEQVMDVGAHLKKLPGIKEISFTNKDQAMADFKERMGNQSALLDSINGNPLPASYQVSFYSPDELKAAVDIAKTYSSVDAVQYGQDIIDQLYKIAQIIRISGSSIASLILWLGYNVILDEIAEAGLVFIPLISLWPFMMYVVLILMAAGILIGGSGSAISLRKYMKV